MISIVIPVYNGAYYLDQCISSVVAQSFQDWECIIVDDGSTDGSGAICDKWAMEDARIRVIHQSNSGVSIARNRAIDESSGDYICFIDADDWLDSSFLEVMYNHTGTSQLVVSGQCREYSDRQYELYYPSKSVVFSIKDDVRMFVELNKKSLLYAPHEKLFKANIIKDNKLTFQVGCSYGEDLQFVYSYLEHIDTVSTIDKALYHYRMADCGTLSTKFRKNQFDEDYRQWLIVYGFYERHGLLCELSNQYLAKRLWGIVYDGIFLYPKLNDNRKHYVNRILSIPEIGYLKIYDYVFQTAKWIKWAILNRFASVFTLYFIFIRKKSV